jgi:ubiquinone/menaquinone biosynthesis C-methylase UbiE
MEDHGSIVEAFSQMAPRYEQIVDSELHRFWGWSYSEFVARLLASTSIQPQDTLLDIATGTGVIPFMLEKSGLAPTRIHGLDITLAMLLRAKRRLADQNGQVSQNLVCASAMEMPYASASFSQITCGLATHHMDVDQLLLESFRVLRSGGTLTLADVGGAKPLKFPPLRFVVQVIVFFYFLLFENIPRAWAEARAVSNVHSQEDWERILSRIGFQQIMAQKLSSRHFWVPAPLLIKACKVVEAK